MPPVRAAFTGLSTRALSQSLHVVHDRGASVAKSGEGCGLTSGHNISCWDFIAVFWCSGE